jgi:pimeloyl-ACP methyl ester carboxylesterase
MIPPTVILLPGLHGTSELFTSFMAAAPQGIRITAVDYPSNEASIEVLERVVRDRLVDPCIIVAESFSGLIGARTAMDDRVKALILCNSFLRSPFLPILGYLAIAPVFSIPLPSFLIRIFLSGRRDRSLVASVQCVVGRLPASILARRVREVSRADERETVKALRKPILYLRGANDLLVSERSWKDLERIRPDARIVRIQGPHMLLQVSSSECWRAILQFVKESVAM